MLLVLSLDKLQYTFCMFGKDSVIWNVRESCLKSKTIPSLDFGGGSE